MNTLLIGKVQMIELGKITSKGQITIPKDIRDALGISGGDRILFEKKDGEVIIKKAQKGSIVSFLDEAKPIGKEASRAIRSIRDELD